MTRKFFYIFLLIILIFIKSSFAQVYYYDEPQYPLNGWYQGTVLSPNQNDGHSYRAILKFADFQFADGIISNNYLNINASGSSEYYPHAYFSGSVDFGIVNAVNYQLIQADWNPFNPAPISGTGLVQLWIDWIDIDAPDDSNNGKSCPVVGQPINVSTGNMYHHEIDFKFSDLLKLERWYNSKSNYSGKFGPKWTYQTILIPGTSQIKVIAVDGNARYYNASSGYYYPVAGTAGSLTGSGPYIEQLPDGSKNYFDSSGNLTKSIDPKGKILNYDYSQSDRTTITDDSGNKIILYHNGGNIYKAIDPQGNIYNYSYDTNGNLASIEFVKDNIIKYYDYQSPNLLIAIRVNKQGQEKYLAKWRYGTGDPATEPAGYAVESSVDGTYKKVTLSYDTVNQITVTTDSNQNTTTYNHQNVSGLRKVNNIQGSCNCGNSASDYDKAGNILWRENKNHTRTSYSNYDIKGNPGTIVEGSNTPNPRITSYKYLSGTSLPTEIKKKSVIPFGSYSTFVQSFVYDSNQRLVKSYSKGNTKNINGSIQFFSYSTSNAYNQRGDVMASMDRLGRRTTFDYYSTTPGDPNHQKLKSVTHPFAGTQTFGNYSSGRYAWMRDVNGIQTNYTYDANGRLLAVAAHSRVTTYGYDAFGNMTSTVLPKGQRTSYGYDSVNRLVKMTDASGNYTSYAYDNEGNKNYEVSKDSNGNILSEKSYVYDSNNRLWKTTSPDGTVVYKENGYDANGNITDIWDQNRNHTINTYDVFDQLSSVTSPEPETGAGTITSLYATNANNNVISNTDGENNSITSTYDDSGRLVESISGEGQVTRYEYDAVGNLLKIRDPNGHTTEFTYNELNLPVKKHYADNKEELFDYYATGLIHTKTSARGIVTTYVYDDGRMTSTTYSDSTPSITHQYDPVYDRVTKKTVQGLGDYNYTYDENARVRTVDGPWDNDTLTYSYDGLNRVKKIEQQGGETVIFTYDTLGRLTDIIVGARVFHYAYTGANIVPDSLTRPNGSVTTFIYDNLYRLKNILNKDASGAVIKGSAYIYNKANMRTQETITNGDAINLVNSLVTYSNNVVNQLASSTNPQRAYSYDADGNMTSWYTPDNYLVTASYDAENRLNQASYTDGSNVTHAIAFTYNLDNFIAKQIETVGAQSTETRFVRDNYLCLQERDSNNSVTRAYAWDPTVPGGIGGLLELAQGGQLYDYLYDGRGNVSTVIDSTNAVVASYTYDPVGKLISKSGTLDQPYQFSTKYYYPSFGGNHFGVRTYLPVLGKWATKDPLGEKGGLNLYQAMRNNPLNYVDPLGLQVVITILRINETPESTSGNFYVNSTITTDMYAGFTLERPADGDYPRIPGGEYTAHLRTDHEPNRIELENVPDRTYIQIHNGNEPSQSQGCILVGRTESANYVGLSVQALNGILNVIRNDSSGEIVVRIIDPLK